MKIVKLIMQCGLLIAKKLNLDTSLIEKKEISTHSFNAERPLDVSLNSGKLYLEHGIKTNFDKEIDRLIDNKTF